MKMLKNVNRIVKQLQGKDKTSLHVPLLKADYDQWNMPAKGLFSAVIVKENTSLEYFTGWKARWQEIVFRHLLLLSKFQDYICK